MLAVAATVQTVPAPSVDPLAWFSNYGQGVRIAAPVRISGCMSADALHARPAAAAKAEHDSDDSTQGRDDWLRMLCPWLQPGAPATGGGV